MKRRRKTRRVGAGLLAMTCVGLTGCTSGSPLYSGKCADVCTGKISGASYSIRVPESWNGTLVIYEHGYRNDLGKGPGKPALSQLDKSGRGDDSVSTALLSDGYAIAGSSYASAGWAVGDAVKAANDLYARFTKTVRKPQRTLVWGSSLGGLATEVLSETAPWVDGAAPLCGVVAGPDLLFDHLLTAAVATKVLLAPNLQIASWPSASSVAAQAALANHAIQLAAKDRFGGGAAKVVFLSEYLGLPTKTQNFDGATLQSEIAASALALRTYVTASFVFLYDAQLRYGGSPAASSTSTTRPLDMDQAARVAALSGNSDSYGASVQEAPAVQADAAARAGLAADGSPTGRLRVPTLTMHTVYDPYAIVSHESVLRARVAAAGESSKLAQVFIGPPTRNYGLGGTPSTGIGHCAFSARQMTGSIKALDDWVRSGHKPSRSFDRSAFGPGIDSGFSPPDWPLRTA